MRQARNLDLAQTLFLQRALKVVGKGADVTVRPPGGDDHTVGHRAFAPQVDEDDVLGLVVVETRQDGLFQWVGADGKGSLRPIYR